MEAGASAPVIIIIVVVVLVVVVVAVAVIVVVVVVDVGDARVAAILFTGVRRPALESHGGAEEGGESYELGHAERSSAP
jgi:flagellar basal body-associated protein FliL